MIGSKKLSTIQKELQSALAAAEDDPIGWLEERVTVGGGQGSEAPAKNEVLNCLRRFLHGKTAPRRLATKKSKSKK